MSCPSATECCRERERDGLSRTALFLSFIVLSATDLRLSSSSHVHLPHQLLESAGPTSPDATTPAHHSKRRCTGSYRLIRDLQDHMHMLKDLRILKKNSLLCPFLKRVLVFCVQSNLSLIWNPRSTLYTLSPPHPLVVQLSAL